MSTGSKGRTFRIPFGRDADGVLVARQDAQRGMKLTCPGCSEPLVFRAGAKVAKHFSHRASSVCSGESALHQTAKLMIHQVVERVAAGDGVVLLVYKCPGCGRDVESELDRRVLNGSVLEARLPSGRVVDVLLTLDGEPRLGVEVLVTHEVDDKKAAEMGISWVEVIGEEVVSAPRRWQPRAHGLQKIRPCRRCRMIDEVREEHVARALANAGESCPAGYTVQPVECYKCHSLIPIFRWGDQSFSNRTPPAPRPATIVFRKSLSAGTSYWANTCARCKAPQGDHFLRTAPWLYVQDEILPEVERRLSEGAP